MNSAPKSIRLISDRTELHCLFADELSAFVYSAEYLRVFSPSAELRGHSNTDEFDFPQAKSQVSITHIERAGHYAIKLIFSDGHDSGIYTWAFLHELHQKYDCNWQRYKSQLNQRGLSRDPDEQAIRIM